MKRSIIFVAVILSIAVMVPVQTWAGNGAPSGGHFQFNLIGHPKNVEAIGGDDSNGRAIMVPLKNATGPNQIVCEAQQYVLSDDTAPTFTDQER